MIRTALIAALLVSPVAVAAQGTQDSPPQRVRSINLKPGEKCPPSTSQETVVCSTIEEPYRIPKELRPQPAAPANQSWANRAAVADEVGKEAAGLPDTCSPVGTGGQTGCTQKFMERAAAERRARKRAGN